MNLKKTVLLSAVLCCLSWTLIADTTAVVSRDSRWAMPIEKAGLPNFHKVTDMFYRGAQPTAAGMKTLKAMGIKTVVNLRAFNSDRDELGDLGLNYHHIYFKTWHPETEDIIEFLLIVSDPANQPVFVHCQHGADRTGMMAAFYRIVIMGWSKDDAISELTDGGYGFHGIWKNISRFIRKSDSEKLKAQLAKKK